VVLTICEQPGDHSHLAARGRLWFDRLTDVEMLMLYHVTDDEDCTWSRHRAFICAGDSVLTKWHWSLQEGPYSQLLHIG
jgi:hypothetical protein